MSQPPQDPQTPEPGMPGWSTHQPDSDTSELPPTHVPYGRSTDTSSDFSMYSAYSSSSLGSKRGRIRLIGAAVPVVLFVVGGGFAIKYFNDHVDTGTSPFSDSPPANVPDAKPPDMFSPSGYRDFLGAIKAETGKTLVFQATIYPEYAAVELPLGASSQHESLWTYDGALSETPAKGSSDVRRFDLADVDTGTLNRLVRRAKALVRNPTAWYVIIDGAGGPFSEQPLIRAYANNEFSKGAYVSAALTGKIIDTTTF